MPWAQKGRGQDLSHSPLQLCAEAFWREGDTKLEAGDSFLFPLSQLPHPYNRDQEDGSITYASSDYCEGCGVAAVIGAQCPWGSAPGPPQIPKSSDVHVHSIKWQNICIEPVTSLYMLCVISGLFKTPNTM